MRIYLDLCAIQRPLDTFDHVRIALEAEAVLGILSLCDTEQVELISSEALELRASKASFLYAKNTRGQSWQKRELE